MVLLVEVAPFDKVVPVVYTLFMSKNIEGRVQLFLKPENKAKLKLLAIAKNKSASRIIDELIQKTELDLSQFSGTTK